jgi:hypothetical protein
LRKIINKSEADYYAQMCNTKFQSIKTVWNNLNKICNLNFNKQNRKQIKKLKINARTTADPKEIATEFNNYFCNVGGNLSKLLPTGDFDFKFYLKNSIGNSLVCDKASPNELYNIMSHLNNSKSSSSDNLSNFLVKSCRNEILHPLLHVFNLSLEHGIFPNKLKTAKVIPLYKSGDTTLMSNYRPISLISPLAKLLERLMHRRVMSFFDRYNILYDYQFGFRKGYNTTLAIIDIVNMIETELSNKKYVLGLFLDLKKAFDTVDINILLYKLNHYGIRGHVLNWFKSYLLNRNQFTYVNGISSSYLETKCGVPQGSVLGPLLFLVYINDISFATKQGRISLFADDTNIFIVANDLCTLFNLANLIADDIFKWTVCNKLSINLDKTNYMLFKPNRQTVHSSENMKLFCCINNHKLTRVHCVKYLGVLLDENLNWSLHINNLIKKVRSLTGILCRKKYVLGPQCRKTLYFSLIYSSLIYCIEIYGNAKRNLLHPLIIKCNSLLRIIQDKTRYDHVKDLYIAYNTLPVHLLYKLFLLKLMHRFIYCRLSLPVVISKLFCCNDDVHSFNTRFKNQFNLNYATSSNSISFIGPSMWLKLPNDIKECPSPSGFMRLCKSSLSLEM